MQTQDQNLIQSNKNNQLASFFHKACALVLDSFIITSCGSIIGALVALNNDFILTLSLFWALSTAYSTILLTYCQSTLGGLALGLKVCDEDGEKVSFKKALIRSLSAILSGLILGIGYLVSAFTKNSQTLHDLIAKTLVKTERQEANFKYFLYSILLFIVTTIFTIILQVALIGVVSTKAMVEYKDSMQEKENFSISVDSSQWINSPKKIKKKKLDKNKINSLLRLKQINRMPFRLKNRQKKSDDERFKALNFASAVPLKLKGIYVNPINQRKVEVGKLNKFFYRNLSFDVFDFQGNKLKKSAEDFNSEIAYTYYWLPKNSSSDIFTLRVYFPQDYVAVYFSQKDKLGAAFKLKSGGIIQLKEKSKFTYKFAVEGSQNEFDNLEFIPINSSKEIIGIKPIIKTSDGIRLVILKSEKEPITLATMLHFGKKDFIEEQFKIRLQKDSDKKKILPVLNKSQTSTLQSNDVMNGSCKYLEKNIKLCAPHVCKYSIEIPNSKTVVDIHKKVVGSFKGNECRLEDTSNFAYPKPPTKIECRFIGDERFAAAKVFTKDWRSKVFIAYMQKQFRNGRCKKIGEN